MMRARRAGVRIALVALLVVLIGNVARAQGTAPVQYLVTFPEPEHHWLQVEVRFADVGTAPLDVRMSRSSPGRYAVHEFAKNVFSVLAYDGTGRPLRPTRPEADVWRVGGHDGNVRVVYRVFGDYADGTYMAVDTTHAHLNMPATFMWATGLDARPIEIAFVPPATSGWTAGTQLFATSDPLRFTAPNLQYFMDSPTELGRLTTSTFTVPNANGTPARFRVMVHGDATQAEVGGFATHVERVVREAMAVFGEFPAFEPGAYSFLLDLVPWAHADAMEHRNSTYISLPGARLGTPDGQAAVLEAVAHEFFHTWNVERIRPAGLEPFDFTRENITCCLWLAEGFTQYYGELLLHRSGLSDDIPLSYGPAIVTGAGRAVRSAVEMSEHAPFADAGVANDVDDRSRTFISYYTYGAGLALGLDLTLRERTAGRVTLDDYMRQLWTEFGTPVDARPGYVTTPYTLADLRRILAALTDKTFADDFFDRYVEGREALDYGSLFAEFGGATDLLSPRTGWIGAVFVTDDGRGLVVGAGRNGRGEALVPFGSPLYDAGVDAGDRIVTIDGEAATSARWAAITTHVPGTRIALTIERRDGERVQRTLVVGADPKLPPVRFDAPSADQRRLWDGWLASRVAASPAR